ncbi:hypothetical protein C9422_18070 [Pseudomonas sp. B1(2018)]|nr:hypothetical protein C9422_18070 [Pseudomonas sp. B1(2018)]
MSGRRIAAMVVNDNAGELDQRGALESIASKLAPTVSARARSLAGAGLARRPARTPATAGRHG